jgi:alanine racemase
VQAAGFEWRGVFTHFSDADSDAAYTANQRAIFLQLLERIPAAVRSSLMIHADNSAGLESFSASAPFNAVRVGLMQYGLPPSSGSFLASLRPEPVLSFHARVVLVKDLPAGTAVSYNRTKTLSRPTRVAIVAVGYGDGVPTAASNRGFFLVRGQRCPILGRVTMDQTIVDITDVPSVAVGDIATILGAQGADRITVAEFCAWADCIPWEALCTLTQRVQRVYRTDRT